MPDPIKDLFTKMATASRSANLPEPSAIVALGQRRRTATALTASVLAVTVLVVGAGVITWASPFGNARGAPLGPIATPSDSPSVGETSPAPTDSPSPSQDPDKNSAEPSASPIRSDDNGDGSGPPVQEVDPATVLSLQILPGRIDWRSTYDRAGWGPYGSIPDPCNNEAPVIKTRPSSQYTRAFEDSGEVSLYFASATVVHFPSTGIASATFDDIKAEYEQCKLTKYYEGLATRHEISHATASDLFVDEVQVMADVEVPAHRYYRIHLAGESISIVSYGETENRSPTPDPTYANELARLQEALLDG